MTRFRPFLFSSLIATLLICGVPTSVRAQLGSPATTFSAGTVIRSADVNALFSDIYSRAVNREGGTLTGTLNARAIVPTADSTYDLGTTSVRWAVGYFDAIDVPSVTVTTLTCTGCVGATQLASTAVTAAAYGGANSIATFTVDADGRLTAAAGVTPQIPVATGVTGLGTGIATALAVNVGSAGAPVLFNGAGGTPSSLTLTNATGLPWTGVSKSGSSLADLATRSAADLSSGILPDARMPNLTGDVTTVEGAVATTLATVNSNVGSFGGSTAIPTFTVNAKGLITAASTAAVVAPAGTLSGTTLNATVVSSSLTSVGTLSAGAVPASLVTAGSFGAGTYVFSAGIALSGGTPSTHGVVIPTGTPASTIANLYSPDGSSLYYNGSLLAVSAGTVTGSGAANRVAYWTGAGTQSSDADFTFDGTTVFATTLTATTFNTYTFNQSVASGASPTFGGGNFTGIPESAITDGSILARLAANETVTGAWRVSTATLSTWTLTTTDEASDQKTWQWQTGLTIGAGVLRLRALNDAESNGINALVLTRSGISSVAADFSGGTLAWGGGSAISSSSNVALLNANNTFTGTGTTSFAGLLTVSGFGTHSFSASGDNTQNITIANASTGASADASLNLTAGSTTGALNALSQNYTSASYYGPSMITLASNGAGGMSIASTHASGDIRLYSRNTLALTLGASQAATFTGLLTVSSGGIVSNVVTGTVGVQVVGNDTDGNADVEIKSVGAAGNSRLYFSDTAAQSGSVRYTHSSNIMTFVTAGTDWMSLSSAGLLTVSGFGTHNFTGGAGNNAENLLQVSNANTSTAASAAFGSVAGTTQGYFTAFSQGHSSLANTVRVFASQHFLLQTGASGDVTLQSRGATALTLGASQAATFTGAITSSVSVALTGTTNNVGTITTGVWNGTAIGATYGGTGLNSSASTGVAQVASGTWSVGTTLQNAVQDNITRLGTITTGVWNAGAVTSSGTITGVAGTFSGVLSTTSSMALAATQRLYFDGVAASGDTYVYESAANTVTTVANDLASHRITKYKTTVLGASGYNIVIAAGDADALFSAPYITLPSGDYDTNRGASITIGRNTSSTSTGYLTFINKSGAEYSIWTDASGDVRVLNGQPSTSTDTTGTVVGTQTSMRSTKNIYDTYTDNAGALATILATPLYDFDYKSGSYNNQRFIGITTDDSPIFGMDNGKSFNPVTAFGYSVQAFKAQQAQIDALHAELAALKGRR